MPDHATMNIFKTIGYSPKQQVGDVRARKQIILRIWYVPVLNLPAATPQLLTNPCFAGNHQFVYWCGPRDNFPIDVQWAFQRAPNPPEFAQPRLTRVKGRSSPAREHKFGCVCSYMAGVISTFSLPTSSSGTVLWVRMARMVHSIFVSCALRWSLTVVLMQETDDFKFRLQELLLVAYTVKLSRFHAQRLKEVALLLLAYYGGGVCDAAFMGSNGRKFKDFTKPGWKQTIAENKIPIFEPDFLLDFGQFFPDLKLPGVLYSQNALSSETPEFCYGNSCS